MSTVNITYKITLNPSKIEVFEFQLREDNFNLISKPIEAPPKWTALDFNQCKHCPLKKEDHPHCPVALELHRVINRFEGTKSIDQVEMEVITNERIVIQKIDLQRALASLFELILPVCGCPKTEHMKPMSRFHLPLASEEETVFRVTGMYLLSQYFKRASKQGGHIGFKGLIEIYEDLHILHVSVLKRLKGVTTSDSAKNAITLLDMYSTLVPMLLEDELEEMQNFFNAYLSTEEIHTCTKHYFEKFKELSFELEPSEEDQKPLWLRQLDPNYVFPEEKSTKGDVPPKQEETEADRILKKAKFKMTLEPIDPDDRAETTQTPKTEKPSTLGLAKEIKLNPTKADNERRQE